MGVEPLPFLPRLSAQHCRHHAYADTPEDPHSPWSYGSGLGPQLRGLWHAHVGWFFEANPSDSERWIPDLSLTAHAT